MSQVDAAISAFDAALVDLESIRRFVDEVVAPLRQQEAALAPQWRATFRAKLPYYELLGALHRDHLRGIFAHLLPAKEEPVERFDVEARVLLDTLSETYVAQARVFADLAEEYGYEVVPQVHRAVPGRVVALSLSGSVFVLDAEDQAGQRRYRYQNIYGNRRIGSEGTCRLRRHLRRRRQIDTTVFHSSPLLLLAVHPEAAGQWGDFVTESRSVSMTLSSRMQSISEDLQRSLHEYTNVIPLPQPAPSGGDSGSSSGRAGSRREGSVHDPSGERATDESEPDPER